MDIAIQTRLALSPYTLKRTHATDVLAALAHALAGTPLDYDPTVNLPYLAGTITRTPTAVTRGHWTAIAVIAPSSSHARVAREAQDQERPLPPLDLVVIVEASGFTADTWSLILWLFT